MLLESSGTTHEGGGNRVRASPEWQLGSPTELVPAGSSGNPSGCAMTATLLDCGIPRERRERRAVSSCMVPCESPVAAETYKHLHVFRLLVLWVDIVSKELFAVCCAHRKGHGVQFVARAFLARPTTKCQTSLQIIQRTCCFGLVGKDNDGHFAAVAHVKLFALRQGQQYLGLHVCQEYICTGSVSTQEPVQH